MTDQEIRQNAIDTYINLLRIRAEETGTNLELNRQIEVAKLKLSAFSIDISAIERTFAK